MRYFEIIENPVLNASTVSPFIGGTLPFLQTVDEVKLQVS